MKLIKPSYEILAVSNRPELPYSYDSEPEKLIELAGRICYKTENNITKESSINFVNKIKKRQHFSVYEHSWKYKFFKNSNIPKYKFLNYLDTAQGTLVAGNFRAFEEWEKEYVFNNSDFYEVDNKTIYKLIYEYKRWNMLSASVKLIVDRGVSHELVRHRPASYSQESTRYCNYSKNKFGGHITYIIPQWVDSSIVKEGIYNDDNIPGDMDPPTKTWFNTLKEIEKQYFSLLENGWTPEKARSILPNLLKTEIVVTCDLQEWIHIFNLRALGISGTPHPQMKEVMIQLYKDFVKLFPEVFT